MRSCIQITVLAACLGHSLSFTTQLSPILSSSKLSKPKQQQNKMMNRYQNQHKSPLALNALLDPMLLADAIPPSVSPDSIQLAFRAATFFPQPLWGLLILLPNSDITKKIMGGLEIVTLCCLIHFFIVSASIIDPSGATAPVEQFNGVFDPSGDPQAAFMGLVKYPNFVSEEWSHVLTWDLFLGRWIWLDGLRRGIFTPHSVLLCNLIGPPGLLLHFATCVVTGKGLPGNEAEELEPKK